MASRGRFITDYDKTQSLFAPVKRHETNDMVKSEPDIEHTVYNQTENTNGAQHDVHLM